MDALVLELTESSVLPDPARIGNVLAHLGELGIGLSLDDFGTGYSSLSHLRSLPVGEVKIDRSFVTRMHAETADAAIVHATIQLAHKLGIRVVAEGVENERTDRPGTRSAGSVATSSKATSSAGPSRPHNSSRY